MNNKLLDVESILCNGRKILSDYPDYDNRDLINAFFVNNPQYRSQVKVPKLSKINNPKNIAILGAGPSGLIAAYALAIVGHHVIVYEKRSQSEFTNRWQYISINIPEFISNYLPELDSYLKFHNLIQYENEQGNPSKLRSYRLSIGDLQNALFHVCLDHMVTFSFDQDINFGQINNVDVIIIATGTHSLNSHFAEMFGLKRYNEYSQKGIAAIYYEPATTFAPGLYKERSVTNQSGWKFQVRMVGHNLQPQIERLSKVCPNNSKFSSEAKNPAIFWFLFSDQSHSEQNQICDVTMPVKFVPSFAEKGAIIDKNQILILWGDARTGSHPMTGMGITIPFLSMSLLTDLMETNDIDRFNLETEFLAKELLIKTLLVSLF
jgi:hypothetical protein